MTRHAISSSGASLLLAIVAISSASGQAQEPSIAEALPPSQWQHLTERLRNNLGQVEALTRDASIRGGGSGLTASFRSVG